MVGPGHRGIAAGLMNLVGWLGGGATAPLVVGYLAQGYGLGRAISSAALVYLAAGAVLLVTARWLLPRDLARPATS